MEKYNKIVSSYNSNTPLTVLEKELGTSHKTIRKIWKKEFGTEKRNKVKHIDIEQEIISLFHSDTPITKLEKDLNTDQRKIRKIWRNNFGTSTRKVICNQKRIECSQEVFELISNGKSIKEVSEILKISKTVIYKYIKLYRTDLLEKLKEEKKQILIENMKKLRKKDVIPINIQEKVLEYFYSDNSLPSIGILFNISTGSVKNIFTRNMGIEEYKKRVKRMITVASQRSFNSLYLSGKYGSWPERRFYELIKNKLKIFVKHHDFKIVPPYEIDITIPDLKIAINWNGITHQKPIFGEKYYNKTISRDRYKDKKLTLMGWSVFTVIDVESKHNDIFINEQLGKLLDLIKKLGFGEIINE